MEGMPRRVADYSAQFGSWNLLISIFSFLLGAAQLIFLYNMVVSWRYGPAGGRQPVAREDDRVAVSARRRRSSTSTRSRASSAARTSTACPGARHAIMVRRGAEVGAPEPAVAGARREPCP